MKKKPPAHFKILHQTVFDLEPLIKINVTISVLLNFKEEKKKKNRPEKKNKTKKTALEN